MPDDSPSNISATAIADRLQLNQVVVRKDLAEISGCGKPKVGYLAKELLVDIEEALGYHNTNSALLVGVGNLGRALLSYKGFEECGICIDYAFDRNPALLGEKFGKVAVLPVEKLPNMLERTRLHIGIIAVPEQAAQIVCDILTAGGIKAIWNFSPVRLNVSEDVMVRNENMALSLSLLSQHLARTL
jgi:redox-sensing transcriptional repressor